VGRLAYRNSKEDEAAAFVDRSANRLGKLSRRFANWEGSLQHSIGNSRDVDERAV
jgi:hypothetical protein